MAKVVLPNEVLLGEVARLLAEGREVVITPKGKSMLPFIHGEVDRVKLRHPDELKRGDIVLAHFGGSYVLHRIIDIKGDKITLMGDGNWKETEECDWYEVKGVVAEIIKSGDHHCKPGKAWLWRHTLFLRKYLLKVYRKWMKLTSK